MRSEQEEKYITIRNIKINYYLSYIIKSLTYIVISE